MTTVAQHFERNTPTPYNLTKYVRTTVTPPKEVIQSARMVGIEVEVENSQLRQNPPSGIWQHVTDGSLRNNGLEWITRPHEARFSPYALRELLQDCLEQACCFSPRTSIHVHVNCLDLTLTQIQDIILTYAVLEPLLYQFVGKGRSKNIYCVPLVDTNLLTGLTMEKLDQTLEGWSKYTGLNILPLQDKGTIEFRQMHGTFDHDKVSVWIRMLTSMIDWTLKSGTAAVRKLIHGMDETVDLFGLLVNIFGESDVRQFSDTSYRVIEEAVSNVKLAFYPLDSLHAAFVRDRDLKAAYFKG